MRARRGSGRAARRGRRGLLLRNGLGEDGIERPTHLADVLVAVLGLLAQGGGDDAIKAGVEAGHLLGGHLEDALRQSAREHLVQHHAHGINVRAMIHRAAQDQRLRGHEVRGAHDHAALGEPDGAGLQGFGQAKVGDFHLAFGADHDVGGFDVAVDDAFAVRVVQGIADMGGDGEGLVRRESALTGDQRGDVGALDKLHDQVAHAIRHLAKVMHRDDAGEVQLGHGAGFLVKALAKAGVERVHGSGQHLDGHRAIQ